MNALLHDGFILDDVNVSNSRNKGTNTHVLVTHLLQENSPETGLFVSRHSCVKPVPQQGRRMSDQPKKPFLSTMSKRIQPLMCTTETRWLPGRVASA